MRQGNPPIAEELDKLREKPPLVTNREPLSRLERMAILDGLCHGDAPGRIWWVKKWRNKRHSPGSDGKEQPTIHLARGYGLWEEVWTKTGLNR